MSQSLDNVANMHELLTVSSQPRKEPFGVCDNNMYMYVVFVQNAIATLPSQNNDKLHADMIKIPYLL